MLIALGFLILIIVGSLLLSLPIASNDGERVSFIDAVFTATSASCVTGLVVFDTYTQWSLFGLIVILVLIQIGGLGFMTIITMFSLFLRRKIGLTERTLMRESINTMYVGGIVVAGGFTLLPGRLVHEMLFTWPAAWPDMAKLGAFLGVMVGLLVLLAALSWAARFARACRCDQEVRAFGVDPQS